MSIIFGVATAENGVKYKKKVNRRSTKEYALWVGMIERCYVPRKTNKTYAGCTVHSDFLDFQTFMLWAEKQKGFGKQGYQLDKDVLSKGNKIYSPETCVFVHKDINMVLVKCEALRGSLPIGVYYHTSKNKFVAQLRTNGSRKKYIGSFENAIDAFKAYKLEKEKYIKYLAEKYKEEIDVRVYEALLKYEVEIDD